MMMGQYNMQAQAAGMKAVHNQINPTSITASTMSPSKNTGTRLPKAMASYANGYDLGSSASASDNTSSSSDRELAGPNAGSHHSVNSGALINYDSPLDSLRFSLEPHLLEIMKQQQPPQSHHHQSNDPKEMYAQNYMNYQHYSGANITNEMDNRGNNSKQMNHHHQSHHNHHLKPNTQMRNSSSMQRRRGKSPFFTGNDQETGSSQDFVGGATTDPNERFSRKVFVGGLPPDIDEEEITASFRRFGPLVVDWPHKAESKSYFPPKGYAFLLFQEESSVQMLIDATIAEEDKLYLCVSSPTIKDKPVQIRPWRLSDADYVLDASMALDPRKTVFVGGVPRPLKAGKFFRNLNFLMNFKLKNK